MDMKKYQDENAKIEFKHRYWGFQIAIYLFLGGLGGGILFLNWIATSFVFPGADLTQAIMLPNFIALLAIVLGLFFLVEELGQPPVFYRAYVTATSIIKWGAVLLTIASFGDLLWLLGNWSPDAAILGWVSVFNFFGFGNDVWLAAAGLAGFGIMVYTGVMLSTLKAHAFWSTPALPVLFTISAMSTACAGIMLSLCGWPGVGADVHAAHELHELLHTVDIILVFAEITVLMIMVLSFLGAGNRTQQRVAKRWVKGSYAPTFWIGMVCIGLVIPLICNISGNPAAATVASILVLCGGCLLRFLCVWSDDRQPLPDENRYYFRLKTADPRFMTEWYKEGKDLERGQTWAPKENLF
ncbi:MAG: polysulfide reductase NrfD [Eggerthellaceae bacterium]|nr:polysulfide reductase NrfD [Eggerthellaceae bacterium]